MVTETFAVGINMPTKTVILHHYQSLQKKGKDYYIVMNIHKWQEEPEKRIDTKGYVLHCNNMFQDEILLNDYKGILSGTPQILDSKFKISYSLILNIIS